MIIKRTYLLIVTVILCSSCGSKKHRTDNTESAIPVVTEKAGVAVSNHVIPISGNIEGSKTVHLGFMVSGKVNYIAVNEGQPVTQGQLLSSLDPQNYSIAKEIADVNVSKVQDEYNRLKIMHDRQSISESDFTKVVLGLQEAKAQQKLQAKNLSDTKLYASISGVLLKKNTEIGEIVSTGAQLFTVADIRTVKVNAYIPESELSNVKLGQEATVLVGAVGRTFTGKVSEIGASADAASRAFTVNITLDNPQLLIRPGMIAEVKIVSGHNTELLAIPVESILHDQDNQSFVYVVDPSKNRAFKRKISVGQLTGNLVAITSGINAGELVVTGGQQKLNDGSPVTISK
jgi:RND family efflux transporter MFP subunit